MTAHAVKGNLWESNLWRGIMESKQVHFVAMAGLHGCLPNYCDYYETYNNAVEGLAQIHELGRDRTRILKRDSYLELNIRRDGNEYCEIVNCDCDIPELHSDN